VPWTPLLIVVVYIIGVAPTLLWLDFAVGPECLNVSTALEIRRDGHWLIPTLQGQPRIQKPPLTAWITALCISRPTFDGLSSADPATRDRAVRTLAWQTRRLALACTALMLVAVYYLGVILDDWRLGLIAAAACGTMMLVLRFGRLCATDVMLAMWVSVANTMLALAVVRGRWWTGCLLGGAALGLAMLSKGPVALLQTILPFAAFAAWTKWHAEDENAAEPRRAARAIAAGVIVMLLVGLGWFIVVLFRSGVEPATLWDRWWSEVTREGATNDPSSPWYNYFGIVPLAYPWVVFLIVGLIVAARELRLRSTQPLLLALFLLIVPIVVMSLFRDREARYLLPMAGPAAIVAAWGVRAHMVSWRHWRTEDSIVVWIHWIALAVLAVGLPLAGAASTRFMQTREGDPWYPPSFGAVIAAVQAGLILTFALLHRRWRGGLAMGTVVSMLLLQAAFLQGYRYSRTGRSEMKPLAEAIWTAHPQADVYNAHVARRVPSDLSIYLNRTIRGVPDGWSIEPGERPVVLIVFQARGEGPPQVAEGWTPLASINRDRNRWHAFVRLPRPSTTSPLAPS
jgi:4-amino-4-deoxy-L-arabinose transferase-like glycosyltransferase